MRLKRGDKAWKRFWSKVKKGPKCWEWQAGCYPSGYGEFCFKGLKQRTHRIAYAMGHDIPKGMCVLHSCDNPPCVRPSHLWLGTQADNIADKVSKGRQRTLQGAQNKNSKLTEAQVKAIRCDPRTQCVIAKDYKVSQPLISYIKQRKQWKHIN